MKLRLLSTLLFATALVATGCNPFPQRPRTPAVHDFGPAQTGTGRDRDSSSLPPVLVEAPDWLKDTRIRYRLLYAEPTQVRYYADDRWLAPPPDLLAQRLRSASAGQPYRLRIRLTEFEQIFDARDRARIALRFHATAETPASGQGVGERVFAFTRTTPSADAKGAVTAFAAAVEQAAGEVGAWLESLTRPLPAP